MQITFHLSRKDFWHFNHYTILRTPRLRLNFIANLALVPLAVMVAVLLLPVDVWGETDPWFTGLVTLGGGGIGAVITYWLTRSQVMKLPSGQPGVLGEHTIRIRPEGVRESTPVSDGEVAWTGIRNVSADKTHIYLFLDTHMAHVIPRRAFAHPEEAETFFRTAVSLWHAAHQDGRKPGVTCPR